LSIDRALGVASLVAIASLASGAAAASRLIDCRVVRGTIVPECKGAICNQGRWTGDLGGRFVSRVTSIYPGQSGWIFTAWTRVELDEHKGRVETIDEGTTPVANDGGPDLSRSTEVLTLSEASGPYQDYAGTIVVVGGHQVGMSTPYTGRLCRRESTLR